MRKRDRDEQIETVSQIKRDIKRKRKKRKENKIKIENFCFQAAFFILEIFPFSFFTPERRFR